MQSNRVIETTMMGSVMKSAMRAHIHVSADKDKRKEKNYFSVIISVS